jgi:hypothetical protein
MMIINIVKWERELEIQREKHIHQSGGIRSVSPALRPRPKKLKWVSGRIGHQQACESS